ncbi:MAG: MFS transporter [bacterium]|nr:MFS transporter [bacterium]
MDNAAISKPDRLVSRIPFFYGWLMLPIVLVTQIATSPGQTFGISVFNPYLREALSLSHSELSGAYMLGTLLAALPMTLVGAIMDRYGPRITLSAVVLFFGVACFAMSHVSGFLSLFAVFLFLRMFGQGAMGLLAMNTLAMWFNRRLGFASGISSLGITIAMAFAPAVSLWLIRIYSWRTAYIILGVAVWAAMLPLLAIFFRNRPEDVGQIPDGQPRKKKTPQEISPTAHAQSERTFTLSAALRTRAYWIMASSSAAWSMAITGITFHVVQLFLDSGLTATHAAAMFTTMAISMTAARFFGGILADRLPLNLLLALAQAGIVGGILALLNLSTVLSAQSFGVAIGLSQGLFMSVGSTLWVRYYGRPHLGKIQGSLTTIGVAASSMGPFLMGYAHDHFGGFSEILWAFLILFIPLSALSLFATPPAPVPPSRTCA